jgi:hypothetical protein
MQLRTVKNLLEKNNGDLELGQFGLDWIEDQLDEIEEHENRQMIDDDTFCEALSYRVGTLLEVMKEDAPCRKFFLELQILCEKPSPKRNTELIEFWKDNPPEVPVINYGGRH